MGKYLALFRIRLRSGVQYRASLFGLVALNVAWSMMEILGYQAVSRAASGSLPMSFSQLCSYIWLQEITLTLFSVTYNDGEISSAIGSGSIAYELVRPMSLYWRWYAAAAANRIASVATVSVPALLIAFIIPAPYGMSFTLSFGGTLLFLLSTALALGVVVAFAMLMYITFFYTIQQRGVRAIVMALTNFFSGAIVPLPFFPAPLLSAVRLLPFASMANMPLQIFTGTAAGSDALSGIALQLFWLAALICVGLLYMRRATRKVIVQGG